ncbi:acetyl-CoA carboxylase biotin carboxylase subunit [Candidatus Viridilinea mediisalina]|uniref:biotin carboxylase n=1 Tax=Candidatus Viridilinea mediisalina TaxID=2024553 RepID=A0A2A6RLD5_9CHLR|nr:biotin carboxylase N-terminal domain-containing protein [Candidatus Viridilinea mediisalina]PDW03862.1 biotin carboxylase [Candidatus Viridilinea mediisalina]
MFQKVLIANRGEIAVRIVRACRDLGLATVAVYEPGDMGALHVRLADEAYMLSSPQGYRDPEEMLTVALRSGVDAVHPGYGLISEDPGFKRACATAGITLVGPESEVSAQVRDKVGAIQRVQAAGIATTRPSSRTFDPEEGADLLAEAQQLGYPLVIKSCAGGHGRGTALVYSAEKLLNIAQRSSAQAQAAYRDGRIYLEAAIIPSRYIEVPILGDHHGNIIQLGDQDGSIQRNTRKIISEAPAPNLTPAQREAICNSAVEVARTFGLRGACTIEFVLDGAGNHFFSEVKPRIQVEHLVTEMITHIDVVREQLHIAAGLPLRISQAQVRCDGHAIFCRINAEDPWRGYLPSPGLISAFRLPGGPNVRVDSYAYAGAEVPVRYDSLLAKLVVWGAERGECLQRIQRALQELHIGGIQTNLSLLHMLITHPEFTSGNYTTAFSHLKLNVPTPPDSQLRDLAAIAALTYLSRARTARSTTPAAYTTGWHRDSRRLPQ